MKTAELCLDHLQILILGTSSAGTLQNAFFYLTYISRTRSSAYFVTI
jgi:hypothetical protein